MINIAKFFLWLFVIYISWYCEVYDDNILILYSTIAISMVCILADVISSKHRTKDLFSGPVKVLSLFGVYSLVSGIAICGFDEHFLNSMLSFLCTLVVCFDTCYISFRERSTKWLWLIFASAALLCSYQAIFHGVQWNNGHVMVVALSEFNNPNTLATYLLIGFISVLLLGEKTLKKNAIIVILCLAVLSYAIVLTGSRKCILAIGALFMMWVYSFLRDKKNNTKLLKILLTAVVAVAVVFVVINFSDTAAYERFDAGKDEDITDNMRYLMYVEAFNFWQESPLFGIGYNQFATRSFFEGYSHSTYAESLSCTGIIGFLILLIPSIVGLWYLIKKTRNNRQTVYFYEYSICLAVVIILFFLAVGSILYYQIPSAILISNLFVHLKYIENSEI